MGKITGTNLRLFVDDEQISNEGSLTFDLSTELPDASDKDSEGWAEHLQGQRSFSGSGEANANFQPSGDDIGAVDLVDLILNRTNVTLKFDVATGASVTGFATLTGTASLSNVSFDAPNEETTTISFDFTGTGALTKS